jgi:NADH-quinone oxidoreductase subunit C
MSIQEYKEKIVNLITEHNGQSPLNIEIQYDFVVIELPKNLVISTLQFLKNNAETSLEFLTTMCGIHFSDGGEREFALMYQLHNLHTNNRLRIRTFMPRIDMTMPTVTNLFPTANWMEREAYDFYGFHFEGHPSLTRILNMDEMNYHPLRREYALEDGGRTDKEDKYFGR